ncbi:MAG: Hint domain-containing protein, partial [Acetobacteraceae bacterium]
DECATDLGGTGGAGGAGGSGAAGLLCNVRGTRIATPSGHVPVEALNVGDAVLTLRGEARPITWIGVGRVLATRGRRGPATPVIVRRGALGDNVPYQELRVTKGHALFLQGVLIPVECLVNHRSILWDDHAQEVAVYHVELATHDVLIANGVAAESYRDDGNRWLFSNGSDRLARPRAEPCAPVLTGGPLVDRLWSSFLERAGPRPGFPLTEDPDLHLVVDGVRIGALSRTDSACHGTAVHFSLPAGARCVRTVSRAAAQDELGVARDPRALGIALRRIVVRQGGRRWMIDASDPRLTDGFHDHEATGDLRWTTGAAMLPSALLTSSTGTAELVLHVACTARYPLLADPEPAAA